MEDGDQNGRHYRPNPCKVITMLILIMGDLGLNCTLDYDLYNADRSFIEGNQNLDWEGGVLFALLFLQAIVQISIFLALFLSMADTFLFRVGLLGVLIKKFRAALLLHPIYFTFTLFTGTYRLREIDERSFFDLWRYDKSFLALSVIQKLLSIPYYLFNIRSAVKLGSRMYFDRELWISLVKDNKEFSEIE